MMRGGEEMNSDGQWADLRRSGSKLDRVRALLPDDCWVTRNEVERCIDFVGGTFSNGALWTAEMCCLPCRIRAVLEDR
jgi:hypothetical protein